MSKARGFTLLEVLVALTVIAFALGSIIKVAGSSAANASYLRDKTLAHWVAANRLADMQTKDNPWPTKGGDEGTVEMAGREWFWTTEVLDTPDSEMRRVNVSVRLEDDEDVPPVSILTGFITKLTSNASVVSQPASPPAETDP
jgi:general secretion pathway protein I